MRLPFFMGCGEKPYPKTGGRVRNLYGVSFTEKYVKKEVVKRHPVCLGYSHSGNTCRTVSVQ